MREEPSLSPITVEDQRRIEPRHLAEHNRFGRRQIVDRNEMVGDELHPAAITEGADIFLRSGYTGEHLAAALECRLVAAGEDDEVPARRLGAGAAHRTIEHDVAGFAQRGFGALLVAEGERARLDHDPGRKLMPGDRRNRGIEGLGVQLQSVHAWNPELIDN